MGTVFKNRVTSCVGVRKKGTTLIRVSTVMGTLYIMLICNVTYEVVGGINDLWMVDKKR